VSGTEGFNLFTSKELAAHIVDTLVDHGFIEKTRFDEAAASTLWELNAQAAMGRVILKEETQD
jgi:hypothetical protein